MQIPVHEVHHSLSSIWTAIGAFVGGGVVQRFAVFVSKALPPLPPNAGFWAQWGYAIVKGVSGLDPNAQIVPPSKVVK